MKYLLTHMKESDICKKLIKDFIELKEKVGEAAGSTKQIILKILTFTPKTVRFILYDNFHTFR